MEIHNVFSSYLTSSNTDLGNYPKLKKSGSVTTAASSNCSTLAHSPSGRSLNRQDECGSGSSLNGFEYNENLTDGDTGSSSGEQMGVTTTNQRDGFIMICNQFLNYGLDNRGNYEIDPVFGYKIHKDMTYVAGRDVFDASSYNTINKFVAAHIEGGYEPGSFLVTNLSSVISQYKQWTQELPMVEPHYAVKCNPDPVILRLLASLGCSFDCATMGEIDLVLNGLGRELNVSPESIVYANPAKMNHMIQFAMDNEVRLTVFDGEDELYKFSAMYGCDTKLDLLIRLDTTGADCVCNLTNKFGCPVCDAPRLLSIAQKLGLNVVGVCFHVGSGCRNAKAYTNALRDTSLVFKAAKQLGMPDLHIVDIGGGFPGASGGYGGPNMPTFQDMAAIIREAISELKEDLSSFQSIDKLRLIAEPGRYFAHSATYVATKVYSRKGGDKKDRQILYIDDGIYGTFNNIIYDHATPEPTKITFNGVNSITKGNQGDKKDLSANTIVRTITPTVDDDSRKVAATVKSVTIAPTGTVNTELKVTVTEPEDQLPTIVFGPTCDGLDQICPLDNNKIQLLPRCKVGDWLLWDNMGAYTHTASFVFNGYTHIPNKIHIVI